MTLNEAKEYLNANGYELLDESFLGDKYKKYKSAVLAILDDYEVNFENNLKYIEDWIRDYFLDRIPVYDCANAIRDNI